MFTFKEGSIKKNSQKLVIGYDLSDSFSQISIFASGMEEPETLSCIAGTQLYNIPTVIAKRPGVGQWFYGREASKAVASGAIEVRNLLKNAERGEEISVDKDLYDPVALLTLFVKRTLGLLTARFSLKDIDGFMFSVGELSPRTVEVLGKIVPQLGLTTENITYQNHVESFYSFMIHQSQELWKYEVMAIEFNDDFRSMRFFCNSNTTPKVVTIDTIVHNEITKMEWSQDENDRAFEASELDEKFKNICEDLLSKGDVTTAYLLGDGFKDTWAKDSLQVLCKNRRVFQGNNLYSKGAAFAMLDKLSPSGVAKEHIFLGKEKLKSNVGMRVLRHGEDSYYAILNAGVNWFEASRDFEVILDEGCELAFVLTSLTGGNVTGKTIALDGLPERPRGTTRLHIHVELSAVNVLEVEVQDMGFGEIIKSSGRAWSQTLVL